MSNTPGGLPYPTDVNPIADMATYIKNLAEAMRVKAAGFTAFLATMACPNNAFTTIVGATEAGDTDGAYDPAAGIFTAPVPGQYLFTGSLQWAPAAGGAHRFVSGALAVGAGAFNELVRANAPVSSTDTMGCSFGVQLQMATGDRFRWSAFQNCGANIQAVSIRIGASTVA